MHSFVRSINRSSSSIFVFFVSIAFIHTFWIQLSNRMDGKTKQKRLCAACLWCLVVSDSCWCRSFEDGKSHLILLLLSVALLLYTIMRPEFGDAFTAEVISPIFPTHKLYSFLRGILVAAAVLNPVFTARTFYPKNVSEREIRWNESFFRISCTKCLDFFNIYPEAVIHNFCFLLLSFSVRFLFFFLSAPRIDLFPTKRGTYKYQISY